ncbi:MAG: PTS glucose transporter subunit IIA [Clostridia bacterium]
MISFKKKVLAPMIGKMIPIEDISDPVFSGKILGDGLGIIPENNDVFAPVTGEVIHVAETKHAVAILSNDGIELLLHLGIDTVNLKGEGFECFVNTGDTVKVGDKIMTMDLDFVKSKEIDTTCCIIITNHADLKEYKISTGIAKSTKDCIIEFKK